MQTCPCYMAAYCVPTLLKNPNPSPRTRLMNSAQVLCALQSSFPLIIRNTTLYFTYPSLRFIHALVNETHRPIAPDTCLHQFVPHTSNIGPTSIFIGLDSQYGQGYLNFIVLMLCDMSNDVQRWSTSECRPELNILAMVLR